MGVCSVARRTLRDLASTDLEAQVTERFLARLRTLPQQEKQQLRGEYQEAAWGNQVRSYVIHPYKMVKDHRTKFETSDVDKVLDGRLDDFIESYLRKSRSEDRDTTPG